MSHTIENESRCNGVRIEAYFIYDTKSKWTLFNGPRPSYSQQQLSLARFWHPQRTGDGISKINIIFDVKTSGNDR